MALPETTGLSDPITQTCSRAETRTRSLGLVALAIHHPKELLPWCKSFRLLPKLLLSLVSHRFLQPMTMKLKLQDDVVGGKPEVVAAGNSTATMEEEDLPEDILMAIFGALDAPDLVRAAAVCSSWHASYTSLFLLGQCKARTTPCLFYTTTSSKPSADNVACLYSLAEQREYRLTHLPAPPIRSRLLIGSGDGWLVTVDAACEAHLLNPVTGQQIGLPPVATVEHVRPVRDAVSGCVCRYGYSWRCGATVMDGFDTFSLAEFREWFYYKAFVFFDDDGVSSPATAGTGGCVVVLIHRPFSQISVAREGDDTWTWLPAPHNCYDSCVYKDGMLYAVVDGGGEIHVFDLRRRAAPTSSAFIRRIIITKTAKVDGERWNGSSYLTEAPQGRGLLHIRRSTGDINHDAEADPMASAWRTEKIELCRIDVEEETETDCLHEHVLFIGHNQALYLRAEEYPALRANHAYFTDDAKFSTKRYRNNRRDIGVLKLGSGNNDDREELVSPQLWANWPAPIWITPNLTKIKSGWIK